MSTSFSFVSGDGTRLRGWTNDAAGTPLLLVNGLGTTPESWPALLAADCGYRVTTWYHRGTFGSERPADPGRIRVEDHVDDLVALMDDRGVERALLACWSVGVNVGFELARRHPERVAGLLAVAGLPGGTYAAMGGPLRVPRRLRHPLATLATRGLRLAAPALNAVVSRVPADARTAWLLAHSGAIRPAAGADVLVPVLERFLRHDWSWYLTLAAATAEHGPMDVSSVDVPVTLLAGRSDVLTAHADVVEVAGRLPSAEVRVLAGSHFLPLEQPGTVLAALDALRSRSDVAAPATVAG